MVWNNIHHNFLNTECPDCSCSCLIISWDKWKCHSLTNCLLCFALEKIFFQLKKWKYFEKFLCIFALFIIFAPLNMNNWRICTSSSADLFFLEALKSPSQDTHLFTSAVNSTNPLVKLEKSSKIWDFWTLVPSAK